MDRANYKAVLNQLNERYHYHKDEKHYIQWGELEFRLYKLTYRCAEYFKGYEIYLSCEGRTEKNGFFEWHKLL